MPRKSSVTNFETQPYHFGQTKKLKGWCQYGESKQRRRFNYWRCQEGAKPERQDDVFDQEAQSGQIQTGLLTMLKPSLTKLTIGNRQSVDQPDVPGRIPNNLLKITRAKRRLFLDARRESNVIEHLINLPAEGESLHFVIDGRFEPADIIPATRRLSEPAMIKELTVTTLGLNEDNVSTICNGIDAGKIGTATVIVSHYFKGAERPLFEWMKREIENRGGRVRGLRTHSKIILMEMTDNRCFTVEGSANLRSCKSVEQLCMTNDRPLLEFHRTWINEFIESSKQK